MAPFPWLCVCVCGGLCVCVCVGVLEDLRHLPMNSLLAKLPTQICVRI